MPTTFWPGVISDIEKLLSTTVVVAGTIIVLWIVNMGLTGWLAGRKGRESGLWTVIACFTGPLALIAILLVARRERTPDTEFTELMAATASRIRLESDSELELDVAGHPARLRGELTARIKGNPSFRLVRSTEWQWADGSPMTVEDRARLRREVPQLGKHEGWVLILDPEDARTG